MAQFLFDNCYTSEGESDTSDSELEDYSESSYQQLRDGKFEVKISAEGYRCPYCSKRKKKEQYGFKDLLQHASAIVMGSGSKNDKAKHLGLVRYLENLGQIKPSERISPDVLTHLKGFEVKCNENSISLNDLITEKDKMVQAYTKEIQDMQQNANVQVHNIVEEHLKMKNELEQRERELQKREARMDCEREKLALEKEMNARATLEQKKADGYVFKLAEDHKKKADELVSKLAEHHKREKEELCRRTTELQKKINDMQGLKLEIERVRVAWSVMRHLESDEASEVKLKIDFTQDALREIEEELKDLEAINQKLVVKERKTSNELQEARKELINFFTGRNFFEWIGIKRLGELDANSIHAACRRKYPGPEAEEKALELCCLWEDHLRNPDWYPFKIVTLEGGDGLKEIIDEEDEKLKKLKAEWGSEVHMAVITALMEIYVYNPIGRFIISELWNHKEGRKATLCEGVSHILDLSLRAKNRTRT